MKGRKYKMIKKTDREKLFMQEAFEIAKKSNCLHRQVGAVLVKNNKIVIQSYNNIPKEIEECSKVGCIREKENIKSGERIERCRVVHAEQQIIIDCALKRINPNGAVVFCTHSPCIVCAKILANAGIKKIYYSIDRGDDTFKKYFTNSDIIFEKLIV